ncbi:MAG: methyltransferase domain-containing protein [Gammaproteobacteria bacterium]|nr:methyltransferase domain-containing protein [Gammaproteobacteria bacterium]
MTRQDLMNPAPEYRTNTMPREQLDKWYDEDYFNNYPKHDRRITQIIRNIKLSETDNICEFGCGPGHILIAMAGKIHHGTGIDVSEYAVSLAQKSARQADIHNLDFRSEDIEHLADNTGLAGKFDKVLMMDISEHLYDDTLIRFFRSAKTILKPGGQLIIHTPNAGYCLERMKARNFVLKQFESHIAVRNYSQHLPLLEAAGFRAIQVTYLPHYNRIIGLADRLLMGLPFIGRLFRARMLIVARSD